MTVPEEDEERLPILGSVKSEGQPVETAVYARRWWVLTVFSLASFVQALVWNTWGPVTESSEVVFNWDDSNIGMLANYGNIAYIIFVLPVCYFMDVKGLRIAMLVCGFLVLLGTGIRCITLEPVAATWLCRMCAAFDGIASTVVFSGPPLVSATWFPAWQRVTSTAVAVVAYYIGIASAFVVGRHYALGKQVHVTNTLGYGATCALLGFTLLANACAIISGAATLPVSGCSAISSVWFPPDERATSTAISSVFGYLGIAVAFILGPQIVSSPVYSHYNKSGSLSELMNLGADLRNITPGIDVTNFQTLKSDIRMLLFVHFGLAAAMFVLTLIYFPSRPPKPPSNTASLERTNYKEGLIKLASNRAVWLIVLAYALPSGVLGVWASVLDVNLKPLHVSQKDAGWMGFWQTLAGCSAGLLVARFSDTFMKRMKLFLIILFIGAIGSTAWFTILCNKYIELNLVSLYASCILIGLFVNGAIPLFYEISCEASYPVAEGVTGGFLTLLNNLVGIVFLFIMLNKNIGTAWMNWVLLGSVVFALPLLFIFPERYRRTDLDITIEIPSPEDIQTVKPDTSLNGSVSSSNADISVA